MSFTIASIVWLVLLIVFIAVEAATTTLVSIWFCAGAAVALLFSAFVPNAVAQTAGFLVVSLLCLVLMRPLVRKKRQSRGAHKRRPQCGPDSRGDCRRRARAPRAGTPVGVDWAARCDVPLAEGQLAEVVAVVGTTLVLRPSDGSSTRAV